MNRRPVRSVARPLHAALLVAAACGLFGPTGGARAEEFPDEWYFGGAARSAKLRALEGTLAPELRLDTWIGESTSLETLRGKVVIVDFWATWCGPCLASIPKNIELVKNYRDQGFAFLGVHDAKSGWDRADAMVRDKSINYPVARDTTEGESFKAYSITALPTYVAIDRHGKIRAAGLRPDKVEDVVRALLAEAGPATAAAGAAEFPVAWYVGADTRPARFAKLEGEAAPKLEASAWIGEPVTGDARTGRVTVLRFLAPWSKASRDTLPEWSKTAAELRRQGVVVLGVCDHLGDWERMGTLLADAADQEDPAFPLARDAEPPGDQRLPLGVTASAYGVRLWPTTVVIDRAGRVRAVGLRDEHLRPVIDKLMAEPLETAAPSGG